MSILGIFLATGGTSTAAGAPVCSLMVCSAQPTTLGRSPWTASPSPAPSCGLHYGGGADVDATDRALTAAGLVLSGQHVDILPGRLVTRDDPDGNIVGVIDKSR